MMNTHSHIDNSFHLAEIAHGQIESGHIHHDPNHLEFNGIAIPEEVIRQLKMITGESVHTMSSHELDKAAINFAGTGRVVRDADGINLHDMMHEHWGEEDRANATSNTGPGQVNTSTTIWSHHTNDNHAPIFSHEFDDELDVDADDDTPPFGFVDQLYASTLSNPISWAMA